MGCTDRGESLGRVTTTQPLDDASDPQTTYRRKSHTNLRDSTLAPEEVLFRRAGAPIRYAEKDIYYSHERLAQGGRDALPDSDMLKAIHSYSSHFYCAMVPGDRGDVGLGQTSIDEQSMDETALLAFGMLLEEAGREALGRRGDLVFTEGATEDGEAQTILSGGEVAVPRSHPKESRLWVADEDGQKS
jgi:hypothetical protein